MALDRDDFSQQFADYMRNRMRVSLAKYGPAKNAYPHKVDALKSMRQRVDKYIETGNTEYLVDAANFLMLEFEFPSLEGAKFTPTDDSGSPGRVWQNGRPNKLNNAGDRVGTP